jgi:hypothetical protein
MLDKPFREAVGSLQYLALATRPDIAYAVGWLARQVECPRKAHWQAALDVFAYLRGTIDFGLRYTKQKNEHGNTAPATGWSDSDWAGDLKGRRSTSGFAFLFCGAATDWRSVKQSCTARSTAEAELVALDLAVKDALWLRKLEKGLDIGSGLPTVVHEDNEAALAIATTNRRTARTKHIDVQYFAVTQDVEEERVEIAPVRSEDNRADIFTKGLEAIKFRGFRMSLGVVRCKQD